MAQPHDSDETFTNDFDATLSEIRHTSKSIDKLLSTIDSLHYESKVAADMATASKLLYWRFCEPTTIEILETYRQSVDSESYYIQLVEKVTHTEIQPIDPDLGQVVIQSAESHGGRPAAGVATLSEIQLSFELLGDSLTVTEIIDGEIVTWGDAKRKSVRRRINRGLTILINAGFVSSKKEGRSVEYYDEGVTSLSFPSHSQSTTNSRIATNTVSSVVN